MEENKPVFDELFAVISKKSLLHSYTYILKLS